MAVTFSTIIVTYNQRLELRKILESIENQSFKDLEVVVADDGSNVNNLKEIKRKWSFPVRYIWQPDYGFFLSRCRNMAAKIAEGEYVHIIDGDTLVGEHTYHPFIEHLDKYTMLWGLRHILNPKILHKKITQDNLDRLTISGDFRGENAKEIFSGANFVLSREKYLEVLWNEKFHTYGLDDYEFMARWIDTGLKGKAVLNSIAYHINHPAKVDDPESLILLEETKAIIREKNENKSN